MMKKNIYKFVDEKIKVEEYYPYVEVIRGPSSGETLDSPYENVHYMSYNKFEYSVDDIRLFKKKNVMYVKGNEVKKYYGNPLCQVTITRNTITVDKTEKGYTIGFYTYNKKRKVGKHFFSKNYHRHYINVNLLTCNFYTITSIKSNRRKINEIKCNYFTSLLHLSNNLKHMFTGDILSNDVYDEIIEKAFGVFYEKIGTLPKNNILGIIDWFINKNEIKVPNDYFSLLVQNYPTKKILKSHDNNLIKSIMSMYDLNGKFFKKLLNINPNIDLSSVLRLKTLIGERKIKDINIDCFRQKNNDVSKIISKNGLYNTFLITDKHILKNTSNTYYQPVLSEKQKNEIVRIINNNVLGEVNDTNIKLIIDHYYMIEKIREYEPEFKYRMTFKNKTEFDYDHWNLSTYLESLTKRVVNEYQYSKEMIETFNFEIDGAKCYLLRNTNDYIKEGRDLNHCVASYDGRIVSFILSLTYGEERVTVEINYRAEIVQARGRFNSDPSEEIKFLIDLCHNKAKKLLKEGHLTPPVVKKIKNKNIPYNDEVNTIYEYDNIPF